MAQKNEHYEENRIKEMIRARERYKDPFYRKKMLDSKKRHREENKEMYARRTKEWALSNPEKVREGKRKYQIRIRQEALNIVSRGMMKCVNCGIDRVEILEINHKNGGGTKELTNSRGNIQVTPFWRAIISGRRSVDDLEILCKVCNIIHYVKIKFGIDWEQVYQKAPIHLSSYNKRIEIRI